ncbi:hypothetical protein PsorP6_000406 [Peronosclerospora sorghi]|uniref:Uncharacterized protein n=1 Tax=Peronosclerospora sorghi TaxID=230839 RepID=A0ACC0WX25_9STRA|nr:hypothetical protein PsorP6_000406 [Peronosclerospora sorghi]
MAWWAFGTGIWQRASVLYRIKLCSLLSTICIRIFSVSLMALVVINCPMWSFPLGLPGIAYPLDLIGTRVSVQIGDNVVYTGIISTFTRMLKEEGQRALFHGIGPTLFGALPYEGIKFESYDLLPASYQMRWTQQK